MALPTASDNEFPKVIMEEVANDGSATVTPAADHRALFVGEDGLLHLKDSAGAVTDLAAPEAGWASFTPTITASGGGFSLGDGVLLGRKRNAGLGLWAVRLHYTRGSTTSNGTGTYTWGGFGITTANDGMHQTLAGFLLDNGTRYYLANADFNANASTCGIRVADSGTLIGATTPITFATGDSVWLAGILEAA